MSFGKLTCSAVFLGLVALAVAQPVVTMPAVRQLVRLGDTLNLDATVSGTAPLTLQWLRNGRPVAGATTATMTVASASGADNGWYQLSATNAQGARFSSPVFVAVQPAKSQVVEFRAPGVATGPVAPADAVPDAIAVAAGAAHSLALRSDGTVVAWGTDSQGQCRVPSGLANVVAVAAAGNQSLAVTADGRVFAWGSNDYGEANVPANLSGVVAVAAGGSHCLALRADGTVVGWGDNLAGAASVPTGLSGVGAIAASRGYSLALKRDGSLVAWGSSGSAQATATGDLVAIAAGDSFGTALRRDGTVVDWMKYAASSFSASGDRPTGLNSAVALRSGGRRSVVLKADGTVLDWYIEYNVGGGGVNPVPPPTGDNVVLPRDVDRVVDVAIAEAHAVVLRDTSTDRAPAIEIPPGNQQANLGGRAWFGVAASGEPGLRYQWNFDGQPVAGATQSSYELIQVTAVAVGRYSVTVSNLSGSTTSDAGMLTVMRPPVISSTSPRRNVVNAGGALTLAISASSESPVTYEWRRNGVVIPGASGAAYKISCANPTDAGWYRGFATNHVGTSASSVMFVNVALSTPRIVMWGEVPSGGDQAPAGLSGVTAVAASPFHGLALKSDGTVVGWGAGTEAVVPEGLDNVVAVAAARAQSVALKADGTLVTWGRRAPGLSSWTDVVSVSLSDFSSVAVKSDGAMYGWGGPQSATPRDVASVAAGLTHGVALKTDGTVVAWSTSSPAGPEAIVPPGLTNVTSVAAGNYVSWAIRSDGTLVQWPSSGTAPGATGVIALSGSVALTRQGTVVPLDSAPDALKRVPASVTRVAGIGVAASFGVALVDGSTMAAPTVTITPSSQTVAPGGTIELSATGGAGVGETWQWYRDGEAVAGATGSKLILSNAPASAAGSYQVALVNGSGKVTSPAATVAVDPSLARGHLSNLSVRSAAGSGDQTLIVGFVIKGDATARMPVLIRGVGPDLARFGVSGVLTDPQLRIFSGAGIVASNDNWSDDPHVTSMSRRVGAFALSSNGSKDAAIATALAPSNYTAHIRGTASGVALAEIYDATPPEVPGTLAGLSNLSARAQVGTAGNELIAGFVVAGATSRSVLIRATGPGLRAFGVGGTLVDPKLELFQNGQKVNANDDWGGASPVVQAALAAGAFPLDAASKDSALVVTLEPGNYSAVVSGADNATGIALIEVYELP